MLVPWVKASEAGHGVFYSLFAPRRRGALPNLVSMYGRDPLRVEGNVTVTLTTTFQDFKDILNMKSHTHTHTHTRVQVVGLQLLHVQTLPSPLLFSFILLFSSVAFINESLYIYTHIEKRLCFGDEVVLRNSCISRPQLHCGRFRVWTQLL